MSLIGRRFSANKYDDSYPWLVIDEDDKFIYAVFLPESSGRVYKQEKSVLEKYPLNFLPEPQLTLF